MNETALGRTVLLIEDSDTQAMALAEMLKAGGIETHRAASAEQGLEYLGANRPDLVVVDQHLPGMQGTEFCRVMRTGGATDTIPILILTGDTEADVERLGLDVGADDYVAKSSDGDVLLARIELLLRRAPPERADTAPPSFFRTQRILIVDDSPTYRLAIEGELKREGYATLAVSGGEPAVAALAHGEIDCAVVDLVMPGMDGIALCRYIAEHRGLSAALPILVVTSHGSKEKMMEALDAGADDFVEKSADSAVLKARIRALIRRKILHEEQKRIQGALRDKQFELVRERAERKAAEARAEVAAQLEIANRELETANRELKEAHVQLVHAAKMASLGELVAGIAHEVNNPLAFSIGHLRTVARALEGVAFDAGDRLPGAAASKLRKARQRADDVAEGLARVSDLVTKLRTFSRLDEGAFKTADMRECIDSALTFLRHRIGRAIDVTTDFAADNTLFCAPGLLNQVVLNLVGNAIDAVGERGRVRIATRRTESVFQIQVGDSGPGVRDDIRQRIFDPFFTTKEVGRGTGMGLAICYRIVERHRGRIDVGRSPEGGAEFTVHIPLDLAEKSDAA